MIVNAVIGALVGGVSTYVIGPVGPIVGSGVAGYLERDRGIPVGALAGALMMVPQFLIVMVVGAVLAFVPTTIGNFGLVLMIVSLVIGVFIDVVLGVVGGYLGGYVRSELVGAEG